MAQKPGREARIRSAGAVVAALVFCGGLFMVAACRTPDGGVVRTGGSMDELAREYVMLVLATGAHDADFVDAYYGPEELRTAALGRNWTLNEIEAGFLELREKLSGVPQPSDRMQASRLNYLQKQTSSAIARIAVVQGRKMPFDAESKAIYDAVAPHIPVAHFEGVVAALERELPGPGPLIERLEAYRRQFEIPADRLDTVFRLAVDGCRDRTLEHLELPPGESFTIEYVTGKSWSGYNWYQGNYRSLIQVNTDLPIYIDRAIDLACHEGYPGHHVYNVLLEKNLMRDRGWIEFSVYPLFSSQSLIAEGSANYGVDVAFPSEERLEFEKSVLFPAAGLDPSGAERYYRIVGLTSQASYAGNEAARRYLDGEWTAEQAVEWSVRYSLMSPERARQRLRFFEQYRSYVINYNLGKDLVRQHVEALGGTAGNPDRRWEIFEELLSTPTLPSSLQR